CVVIDRTIPNRRVCRISGEQTAAGAERAEHTRTGVAVAALGQVVLQRRVRDGQLARGEIDQRSAVAEADERSPLSADAGIAGSAAGTIAGEHAGRDVGFAGLAVGDRATAAKADLTEIEAGRAAGKPVVAAARAIVDELTAG